jgi:sigma-B regulation protein RsbU (phosphoserine phosphatase)
VGKIAKGNLETRVEVKSRDETAILATAFNQMAADLEKSVETKIAHESMLKELEIAKRIQMGQIPKKPPEIQGLEIVFSLEPAAEVGGDCYDFLRLSDGNYFFHIGDATGHGIPASLVVALGNAALYGGALRLTDPKEIIDRSNEILFAKTEANMFLTSVGCHYEVASQKITFVQAGHDEILQFSKQTKELNLLKSGGMALGMTPDLSAMTEKVEVEWQSGDLLFFYTDGFPEAYQDIEVQLGMDQFKAIIQKYADLDNLEEMKSGIIKDVKEYMGSYPQNDDMTLMIVRKV